MNLPAGLNKELSAHTLDQILNNVFSSAKLQNYIQQVGVTSTKHHQGLKKVFEFIFDYAFFDELYSTLSKKNKQKLFVELFKSLQIVKSPYFKNYFHSLYGEDFIQPLMWFRKDDNGKPFPCLKKSDWNRTYEDIAKASKVRANEQWNDAKSHIKRFGYSGHHELEHVFELRSDVDRMIRETKSVFFKIEEIINEENKGDFFTKRLKSKGLSEYKIKENVLVQIINWRLRLDHLSNGLVEDDALLKIKFVTASRLKKSKSK